MSFLKIPPKSEPPMLRPSMSEHQIDKINISSYPFAILLLHRATSSKQASWVRKLSTYNVNLGKSWVFRKYNNHRIFIIVGIETPLKDK